MFIFIVDIHLVNTKEYLTLKAYFDIPNLFKILVR